MAHRRVFGIGHLEHLSRPHGRTHEGLAPKRQSIGRKLRQERGEHVPGKIPG